MLLIPVWIPGYFPSEDGPAHLYWIEVYRALGQAGHPLQDYFVRNVNWQAPYHLTHLTLQYGLAAVLEPHIAQKLVVTLIICLWAFALQFVSRAVYGYISLGGLAGLLLVHGAWLYGGFFAFLLAMPLVMMALGQLVKLQRDNEKPGAPSYVLLAFFGILAYYTHLFVGALFLLLVSFWIAVSGGPRIRRARLALGLAPTAGLMLWHLAHGTVGGNHADWEPVSIAAARFFGLAFFRGLGAPSVLFWIALGSLALLLAALLWATIRHGWAAASPAQRSILLLAGLCALLFFLAPEKVGEAGNFNGRIQFAMWSWLLPTLPWAVTGRTRIPVLGATVALLAWQVVAFTARGIRFNRDYASILEAAAVIPGGAILRSTLPYEDARYEGSFIRILAHLPEDIAYHREAVLVDSFFPGLAFYWVIPRAGARIQPERLIRFQSSDGRPRLHVTPVR